MQIAWHVHLVIKPGCLESFRQLTDEMTQCAQHEPGLLIFERFINTEGNECRVYERYVDSRAAEEHLKTFSEKFSDRFAALVERKSFVVLGEPSSVLRNMLDGYGASEYYSCLVSHTRTS